MGIPLNLGTLVLMLIFYSKVHAGRIYGGKEAVPYSRPYMVLLERATTNILKPKNCAGFLVREDFVMTAAHCNGRSIKVKLGVHNVQQESAQEMFVKQAFPHPHYDNEEHDNDIMLLKLEKNVLLTNRVRPIGLPQTEDEEVPKDCLVSGWGFNIRGVNKGSSVLLDLNVTLVASQVCSDNHAFCSSGLNGPGQGDSGSSLVCNGVAYGVVSCSIDELYIYTRIPDYLDWITNTMNN
ncbi:mast cell protease 8-like isoform 1-T2 [Salvelinus alpinus]|uniref:mast cell protease 8 n=1 Tax=Salvelinus sp. IW2-2015 TaxID=2691554 RepID=UPI000CDF8067|nr:granzyme-like protein 2 [Salvelinus alpinus]